jgi:hypothetical protein
MHISCTHFNNFTVGMHLGVLHFKSSMFNVPFNNFINNCEDSETKKLFYHLYQQFNSGL